MVTLPTERPVTPLRQRIDGDNDIELNGDELDGDQGAEDAFGIIAANVGMWSGLGCPISDPDSCIDRYQRAHRRAGDRALRGRASRHPVQP